MAQTVALYSKKQRAVFINKLSVAPFIVNMPRNSEQLKPEHIRALIVLEQNLDRVPIQNPYHISRSILNTNSIQIFNKPFATRFIPCGEYWRWNQTKAKKWSTLPNRQLSVSVCKLIPRRKKKMGIQSDTPLPSVKMWQYEVKKPDEEQPLVAMWCERGLDYTTISNNLEPQPSVSFPEIGELIFLSDFMPKAIAKEIWPELCDKA